MVSKVIVSGNLVVATGSIVIPYGHEAAVTPVPVGPTPLTFRFAFAADGGTPTYRIEPVPGGLLNPISNVVRVTLVNFDNALGQAITVPVAAGTVSNRPLGLIFASYLIGQTPAAVRVLHYTFTLAGEQDV